MLSANKGIITEQTKNQLSKYLAFRHFFIHGYGFLLDEAKLKRLVDNVFEVFIMFKQEINNTLSRIIQIKRGLDLLTPVKSRGYNSKKVDFRGV
ncbi:MAG: hypothetical protein AB1414_20985 [bacterium]